MSKQSNITFYITVFEFDEIVYAGCDHVSTQKLGQSDLQIQK